MEEIEKNVDNTALSPVPFRENVLKTADIMDIGDTDRKRQQLVQSIGNMSYMDSDNQKKVTSMQNISKIIDILKRSPRSSVNRQIQNNEHGHRDSQMPMEKTGSLHTSSGRIALFNGSNGDQQLLKLSLPMAASSPLKKVNVGDKEVYCHNTTTSSFNSDFSINSTSGNSEVISGITPWKSSAKCLLFENKVSCQKEGRSCKVTTDVCADIIDRVKSCKRKHHTNTLIHSDSDAGYIPDYESDDNFDVIRKVKDSSTAATYKSPFNKTSIKMPQSSITKSSISLNQLYKDTTSCSEPLCLSGLERCITLLEVNDKHECPQTIFCSERKSNTSEQPLVTCGTHKVGYKRKKLDKLRKHCISELNLKELAGNSSCHIKFSKDSQAKQLDLSKLSDQNSLTHENEWKEKKLCQNSLPDKFRVHNVFSNKGRKYAEMPMCLAGCTNHDITFGNFNFLDNSDSELEGGDYKL
ncbi:hypothetical protein Pcinc_004238 [Petrolisthes cinctipes]|nr:hypothetical protein Pcinc_004238 [Petrolisthes cinctipes]